MPRLLFLVLCVAALGLARCTKRSAATATKLTQAISLSAGYLTSCAVQYGGKLYCWGNTTTGQAGFSGLATCVVEGISVLCAKRPSALSSLSEDVLISSVGVAHSCADVDGAVKCWGENSSGQLGDGTTELSFSAVPATGLTTGITSVAAGFNHSCAVQDDGAVCWGDNTLGQLGDSTNSAAGTAVPVTGLAAGISKVAAGGYTSCALSSSGVVRCWGANTNGQLGSGSILASSNTPVVAIAANATAIASSPGILPGHSCAIVNGGAKCWGLNTYGQLGDGTQTSRNTPTDVQGLSSGVTAIAVGGSHTCAIVNGGTKCWGLNSHGQLGAGTSDLCSDGSDVFSCSLTPVSVSTLDKNVVITDRSATAIAAGDRHSCAILGDQTVECWGSNESAQLGNNSTADSLLPTPVIQ